MVIEVALVQNLGMRKADPETNDVEKFSGIQVRNQHKVEHGKLGKHCNFAALHLDHSVTLSFIHLDSVSSQPGVSLLGTDQQTQSNS